MSEREKWMPSDNCLDCVGSFAEEMYRNTGLRAQVAKLEEMIEGQTGHWVDRIKAEIERLKGEVE